MKINPYSFSLLFFMLVNLFLNMEGNDWGLPYRWHSDEIVADVLHMASDKTLVDPSGYFLHVTGYHLFLLFFFIPVYVYLILTHYPLEPLKEAASVSWIHMARLFPDFASGIYIYTRSLSAILGMLTVYMTYRLGKTLYGKKEGLFSAAFLSVCMGFTGLNHLAKYISLMNFLIMVVLWLSVRGNVRLGFLIAGIASSVRLHGPILFVPLGLSLLFLKTSILDKVKMLFQSFFLYLLGIVLGTPSLLTHFSDYSHHLIYRYQTQLIPLSSQPLSIWAGSINYFFEFFSIYGIPLALMILIGFGYQLFRIFQNKIRKEEIMILSFIISYFIIIAFFLEDKFPETKHIIAIVPPLTLYGGKYMAALFEQKFSPAFASITFVCIFLFSFSYSMKANTVYKREDTRHLSTRWIQNHVPKNSKIEVFDQLHYVASAQIMNDHEIMYLGKSSKNFKDKHFFKWIIGLKDKEHYLQYINQFDSSSDYILIDMENVDAIYSPSYQDHIKGRIEYLRSLFKGEKKFKLKATFQTHNPKILFPGIRGVVYHKNLFWDPIPSYEATANTIYLFEKIK